MGLLDILGNLTDEQRFGLMGAAANMLSGAPGQRKNFGADIGHGLLGGMQAYQGAKSAKSREEEEKQQREMRALQMAQMKQQQQDQAGMRSLAERSFAPPQALDPRQQEGGQEVVPGGGGMAEYARGLMGIDPVKGYALQQQIAQANQPELMNVAPGATVFDKRANRPVFQAPEKTPDWKDPQYEAVQSRIRAAGRPQVNVNTREETEFSKALGKDQGENYSNLMKSDAMANSKLNKLTRLETLLASSGNTGKLTPATMELKSVAESLGFKVDPKLPFQQAAQALSNEIALELRNPAGGAGMPGALSDRDREFLVNMVPNLAKTPEGNKILIDTMKKLAQREKDVAKLARGYRQKTGRFDEGFYQVLGEFSTQKPLFEAGQQPALSTDEQRELQELRARFGRK